MFKITASTTILGILLSSGLAGQNSGDQTPSMQDIRGQMRDNQNDKSSEDKSSTSQTPPVIANQPTTNASTETTTADGPTPSRPISAQDILKKLRDKRKDESVVVPVRPGINRTARTTIAPNGMPENAVGKVSAKLMPDGSRIVDRAGRLTQSGDYMTFTFESRSDGMEEAPLRLLPNRLLEDMEYISEGGRRPIVFVVSGEVTEYHGVNYLLIEKLLQRPDLGNIR